LAANNCQHYRAFDRIIKHSGLTPKKGKGKQKEDEISRFTIGDGVLVSVDGGNDGVGILIRLWEESGSGEDEGDEDESGSGDGDDSDDEDDDGPRMMAEIHWCFRRQDLPGIMKNLQVDDVSQSYCPCQCMLICGIKNEVLLAASAVKPVTTHLPVALLIRTVPIYSKQFFKQQFAPTRSVVKGWTYIKQGVYWCSRAFDKGARGGKVYHIDIDAWRTNGRKGDWVSPAEIEEVPEPESEASQAGSDFEDAAEESEEEDGAGDQVATGLSGKKRKKAIKTTPRKASKVNKSQATPTKGKPSKRVPHPRHSTSNLPSAIESLEDLPTDPYQRALRLLHVGATPESLPCREEEFVDVLGRVEEGVESGGGGCLCESAS